MNYMTKVFLASLVAVSVVGCASSGQLSKVKDDAKDANQTAQSAMSTAQDAQSAAQEAKRLAEAADERARRTEEIVNRSFKKSMYK